MLKRMYSRIARNVLHPTSVTRNRRKAKEKSAKEKTLAIPMKRTRDRGMLRRLARKRGVRLATRLGSRTRNTHANETAAGTAAIRMVSRYVGPSDTVASHAARSTRVRIGPRTAPGV